MNTRSSHFHQKQYKQPKLTSFVLSLSQSPVLPPQELSIFVPKPGFPRWFHRSKPECISVNRQNYQGKKWRILMMNLTSSMCIPMSRTPTTSSTLLSFSILRGRSLVPRLRRQSGGLRFLEIIPILVSFFFFFFFYLFICLFIFFGSLKHDLATLLPAADLFLSVF